MSKIFKTNLSILNISIILIGIISNGLIQPSSSAKILFFFSGGTFSHKVSIWPFVSALADRGHNVTFVSSFSKQPFANSKINDVTPKRMEMAMGKQFKNVDRLTLRLNHEEDKVWTGFHADVLRLCEGIFMTVESDPQMHYLFHNDTFDVMINNEIFGDCGLVLAHRLMKNHGTKLILFNSAAVVPWFFDLFGMPSPDAWVPTGSRVRQFPMNFIERVKNYFTPLYWYWAKKVEIYGPLEKRMRKVYPQLDSADTISPSLLEVHQNASLVLIATHHSTDYGWASPPFVALVGGMQCWQKREPFQGEFKEFLDNAKNGAILIAFGSTIDLSKMPEYFKRTFFNMMLKFPEIQFIWRWDGPLPEDAPKNLKVAKWLPQYDILGHKNLKAFISHAGLNSLTEATYQGVPVISLPLFADQDYNGYRIQAYETGIRLEARTLTPQIMENAVREILTNQKYANNMKRMSGIMRDRPMNPIDTAVYWTEFVLRHDDTSSLKPLNQLNWFQQRMLDVFFLSAFLFTSILIISVCLLRLCYMNIYLWIHSKPESKSMQNDSKSNEVHTTKGKGKHSLKKKN